jgi:hypothetical protein
MSAAKVLHRRLYLRVEIVSTQRCVPHLERQTGSGITVNWPHHVFFSEDFTVLG